MFRRLYHVSSVTFSMKKQGVKLWKMLNPKNKRNWYQTQNIEDCNLLPSIKSLSKTTNEPGKRGIRRLSMLNKMFMKYITDIMSTGTVAMDVVGRGIEISKVNVTPDFQTVNVFWVCKGDSTDMETERLLNSIAGTLRHELSTLRLMGEVPYIMFVKDIQEARRVDLDRRLAAADYGDDYTPTDLGHMLKSEFTLDTKLSAEVMAKIKQLEDRVPFTEDPVPEMTHHVFGLDHAAMMGRLLAARKRSADAWARLGEGAASPVVSYKAAAGAVREYDVGEQNQELAEFLLKRQIQQNKLRKQMLNDKLDGLLPDECSDDENEEVYYDDDDEDYEDDASYYERHEADDNKHPSLT